MRAANERMLALVAVLALSVSAAPARALSDDPKGAPATTSAVGARPVERVREAKEPPTFTQVYAMALSGMVRRIKVVGDHDSEVFLKDGGTLKLKTPMAVAWPLELVKAGVDVDFSAIDTRTASQAAFGYLMTLAPLVALFFPILVVVYLWRMIRSKGSPGEFVKRGRITTRFTDVAGADEAKSALVDVVAHLKDPFAFGRLGGKGRRGILLVGDPGNGKTLLARAVAGEADVPFFYTNGAAFQEVFAGLGASKVRKMFVQLRKRAPAILFIDEFDSLGRRRSDQSSAVQDDAAATLNQLLTELDGVMPSSGIVVVAATNRPDVLDPAVLRPGRFDLQVVVPTPDLRARRSILEVSSKDVELDADIDLDVMARGTPGFSGASLAALVNEATLRASRRGADTVGMRDFEWARDSKLLGGDPRVGMVLDEDEADVVKYHESGHALVSVLKQELDPIHKATVVPRGRALGFVSTLPLGDRVFLRKSKMKAELVMLMAGRAAEQVKFGEDTVTSGAQADIEEATRIARLMVTVYGFGTTMASRTAPSSAFAHCPISQRTMERVDEEVEGLIKTAYEDALRTVSTNRAALEAIADAFDGSDTLTGPQIVAIVEATADDPRAADRPEHDSPPAS